MPLSKRNVMRAGYRFVAFLTVNKSKLAAVFVFTAPASNHCLEFMGTAYSPRDGKQVPACAP